MGAFLRTVTVLARVYSGKENHGEYSRRKGLVIGLDLPYTSEGIMGERMAGRDSQTRGSLTNLSEVLAWVKNWSLKENQSCHICRVPNCNHAGGANKNVIGKLFLQCVTFYFTSIF